MYFFFCLCPKCTWRQNSALFWGRNRKCGVQACEEGHMIPSLTLSEWGLAALLRLCGSGSSCCQPPLLFHGFASKRHIPKRIQLYFSILTHMTWLLLSLFFHLAAVYPSRPVSVSFSFQRSLHGRSPITPAGFPQSAWRNQGGPAAKSIPSAV